MSFEHLIAGRYLRAKRKQAFISLISFLSVAGVSVGVMALVVVIAVMSGAESDFRSRILGVDSHILLMRHGNSFKDHKRIADLLSGFHGVKASSPFVYSQVMIRSNSNSSGAILRGVDPDSKIELVKGVLQKDLAGKLTVRKISGQNHERPGIILGKGLAATLRVSEGDAVYLMTVGGMMSPAGLLPSMRPFRVTGIFESGMYEYDGSLAYINIHEAQRVLRMNGSVTGIGIWVDDVYSAGRIAREISDELKFPYWTRDWMQMNKSLFSALKLEKAAMFIILTLIILVAAFNIASSLIMMVMEKSRDIAILKAMGATDASVRKIFVVQGLAIGFTGTSIGIALGVGISLLLERYPFIKLPEVYPFSTLPVQLELIDVLVIAVSAMLICFLSTLYPAVQASRQDPVEGIRYG